MIELNPLEFSFEKIIRDALYEDLGQQGDITSKKETLKRANKSF